MKTRWMKAIRRVAVFVLTAALLVNAVDCNQLFVKAETVEDADNDSGNGAGGENGGFDEGSGDDAGGENGGFDEGSGDDAGGENGGSDEGSGNDAGGGNGGSDEGSGNDAGGESGGSDEGSGDDAGGESGGSDEGSGDDAGSGKGGSGEGSEDDTGRASSSSDAAAPANGSVSGNDIPGSSDAAVFNAAPAAADAVSVTVTVCDAEGTAMSGAMVRFTDGGDAGIDFTDNGDGTYSAELDGDGNISVSKPGYVASNWEFSLDGEAEIRITLKKLYTYTVNVEGSEYGSVTKDGGSVSGSFTHDAETVSLSVEPGENCYIQSIQKGDSEIAEAANQDQAYQLSLSSSDNVTVIFAPKESSTVTITGKGSVTPAGETKEGEQGVHYFYYFPDAAPVLTVKADENCYIQSIQKEGSDTAEIANQDQAYQLSLSNGDNVTITFAPKASTTVTITGSGSVTPAGKTKENEEGTYYYYYLPGKAPELTVKADKNWYLDSVVRGSTKNEYKNVIQDEDTVTPKDDENIEVVFLETWTQEKLKTALTGANSFLNGAAYNQSYALSAPLNDKAGYSYVWQVSGSAPNGVKVAETGNKLIIPRNAAGTTFSLQVTATLSRGTASEKTGPIEYQVSPCAIAADKNDYVFTFDNDNEKNWIKVIRLLQSEKNAFTKYELKGTNLNMSGDIDGKDIALGKIEVTDAQLVLSGTENGEGYSSVLNNLKIDTKAPVILAISYEKLEEGGRTSVELEDGKCSTNKKVAITVTAQDNGSGIKEAVLTCQSGESERTLRKAFDTDGKAEFLLEDGEYTFTKLSVTDQAQNEAVKSLNASFSIDTTPPQLPTVDKDSGVWRKGNPAEYGISSTSQDTAKFVICTDDGNVDWDAVEAAVAGVTVPDGVTVLEASNAQATWALAADGVLNQGYQLKSLDGHGNFSEAAASFTVLIDNEKPVAEQISFAKNDTENPFTWGDTLAGKKLNASVSVEVTGISDNSGSGVAKVALANGEEETPLTYVKDAGMATLLIEAEGSYTFKELRVYDEVGNCYGKELDVTFQIDTTSPSDPVIEFKQHSVGPENGWIAGTACSYTITSAQNAADTWCFEIYEEDGTSLVKEIEVTAAGETGASVIWDVPLGAEEVFKHSYLIRARDCEDQKNANYSGFTAFTVQIDNKKPTLEAAYFGYGEQAETEANVATKDEVTLTVRNIKDGENPPEDQAGLASVKVSYDVEIRQPDTAGKTTETTKNLDLTVDLTDALTAANGGNVEWKLPCEDGKYYKYSNITILVSDKLGNTLQYEGLKSYTVEIDQRGPSITAVEWNADSGRTDYWFNEAKEAHRFIVTAQDDTGLSEITVTALDGQGKETASVTRQVSGTQATADFGAWVYDRSGAQAYPDKKETYTVRVKDQFGNVTAAGTDEDFSQDPAPREVRIDKTLPVITGAAGNEAEVTYQFSNVKARSAAVKDGELTEKDHLVNGVLLSKEDVTVTVNAFDPKMDQDGETESGTASGIVKAELLVETEGKAPEANTFANENPNLESGHDYVFELKGTPDQETVFVLKAIRLTDLAGNVQEYMYEDGAEEDGKLGALTVVIDHKAPESLFDLDKYSYTNQNDELTGWYSAANGNPLNLTAKGMDAYGVHAIAWYQTTYDRGIDVAGLTVLKEAVNDGEGADDFADTLNLTREQDQLYAVKVTDWAGNEKVFSRNTTAAGGSRIRIDNTAPENLALIHWEGDYGSSFNDVGNDYAVSQKGYVYNKNRVTLSVLVRDDLVSGLLDGDENGKVSSDIERVEVTINHEDSSEKLTSANGNQVLLAEVQGKTYLEFKFENIELTAAESTEVEKYIESIVIYDNAGNKTPAEGRVLDDEIKYILDSRAPKLSIDYHDGSFVENALFPDTYFYKDDPAVNALIEERYFYAEDVKVNLREAEAEDTLNQSEWSMGGTEHDSVFSAPGDGRYRFSLEYTDRSGNVMIGDDVADGKYVSKYVVMDTTSPEIEITYEYNGHDVTDEIYDGNFFAGTVKATVRIREMNFDPDMVEIEATGKDSQNNSGIGISWDGGWTQESADVNVNTVTFDQQGTYQFTCTCRDIVGHEAERPAQSHFVVDTTKPEVEILYDLNDPMNEKYYKAARTATVRVTDRSFDPEQVDFIVETSGSNPAISEWVHKGGSGCENQLTYHVDSCVYEATVAFAEDGDYSLGFSCVDKAGNESDVVMTDPFTVDQTFPEMVVTYDNNDARNEYYYNAQRIGTIQITEHNFNPEDVQIVTTAQHTESGAPAISGWRNDGDVHTTTIVYDADADYTFDISYIDMAGNEADAYAGDRFVVDTTVPVLQITDIEDKSANNGTVAPGIEWSDINLDTDGVFMSLTGANNGEVTVAATETVIEGGMKIQYQDFPHEKEMDDLYTFHATVSDLAGNVSEQTVMFSVNRFGSVYVFDSVTQDIVDRYYINKPARLNVTEINVDTLEFKEITYSKNGDIITMKASEDYNVTQSGTEATWKSYNYDIFEHSFTEEGAYAVTIYSEDRATNKSNNIVKEKVINFVMDTTAPTVVVTGVENEEQYHENSRIITIDAKDNIYLAGVTVYLDGKPVQTFDEETLLQNGGVVTMEVGSSNEWQTLVIRAIDAAGNEGASDTRVFLITRNILVQWYRNVPLFWGSIAGMAALAALIIFFLFYKKRKKEEEGKAA